MGPALKADDLVPLVLKLSHDEQVRLAKLALRAASRSATDASAYAAAPVGADELSSDDDPLARDADGWDDVDAAPCEIRSSQSSSAMKSSA